MNRDLAARFKIPYLRWWIIGMCFLGTTINYIDRQRLSVAADTIMEQLHFSHADYALMGISFLIAYAIMQFVSGWVVDKIGVRWGMAFFALWWCVASTSHGLCIGLVSFCVCRFLLGMGEAGNWPSATKAVSEWFPTRERGLAVAIFDSGACVGAVIAPPLVVWLINHYSWRIAFLATPLFILPWLAVWLWIYRSPDEHPRVTERELEVIHADRPRAPVGGELSPPWYWVLVNRETWGVFFGRFFADSIWWFYVAWLPLYLREQRHFSLNDIAAFAWIPFVAADLGNLSGGGFSSYLLRRGWSLNAARKTVMVIGVVGMLAGLPAGLTSSAALSLALITLVVFSVCAYLTMMLTLPTDLFPSRQTASASGFSGMGATLGGVLLTWLVGIIADKWHSYTVVFAVTALMPLIALGLVQLLIPRVAMMETE